MDTLELQSVLDHFDINVSHAEFESIEQGYINDTYIVFVQKTPLYILQSINQEVFKNVDHIQFNIDLALKKLESDDYIQIVFYNTKEGKRYLNDGSNVWRLQNFVKDSVTYNFAPNEVIAFEAGKALGNFHSLLGNENSTLYKTIIPNLNYLPFRIDEFNDALISNRTDRLDNASTEVTFAKQYIFEFEAFFNANLPYRICHNDAKLNNILFNKNRQIGLCLIDLDTVMKGYFHYDFGDLVRTVVSESKEDEKELSKIKFNSTYFTALLNGLNVSGIKLSAKEKEQLPIACALMPFMHGLRALTDHLNGDIYYKVTYEEQNLDRSKSLFKFTEIVLKHQEFIKKEITRRLK